MLYLLKSTEIEYVKCFSEYSEDTKTIRFWDDNLTDMYAHNFTYIKESAGHNEILEIILREIERRKQEGREFLQIVTDLHIDNNMVNGLPFISEVTRLDYMCISTNKYKNLNGNSDCRVCEAVIPKMLEDGIQVDIMASTPSMGSDFAVRRIARKVQIYKDPSKHLKFFVCYHDSTPVGNCELFVNGSAAKIEDFDILEQYQRRGFGTSVLKHLIEQSILMGAETAYVITDSEDTAKEMYRKCGFNKVSEKTELFFRL